MCKKTVRFLAGRRYASPSTTTWILVCPVGSSLKMNLSHRCRKYEAPVTKGALDLRGIPWRDGADRTRRVPPSFLPPSDDPDRWLINLEELPSALPMVQAALYQLVLDRKCGGYELPEGASLIACGNRESDRGVTHRMATPLASRFVHLETVSSSREFWR